MIRSKCISNWKKCESCRIILEQNKFELHVRHDCPPSNWKEDRAFGYIYEKKLFSFVKIYEPSEKDGTFFDDVIQISLPAAQLCDFAIGESVVIATKSGRCIVKPVWPIEDNILSSVFLTKQSTCELDDLEGAVEIRKIEQPPSLARTVFVDWLRDEALSENHVVEIAYMLSVHCSNKIVTRGQHLVFNYFGTKVKLKVLGVAAYRTSEDEIDFLNDDFANVHLDDEGNKSEQLYRISTNTSWKFESTEPTGRENGEKRRSSNLGAMEGVISELKSIVYRILTAEDAGGQKVSCGIIIHGVCGTGKTCVAEYVIESTKRPVIHVCNSQIFSRYFGEAENRVKMLFEEAIEKAPSVILIDELDTFCPGKAGSEQGKRVLAVLLSMMDKLNAHRVVVIGVTRQLDGVDIALRRPGRFDFELEIPVPDANSRVDILRKLLCAYKHDVTDELIAQLGKNASHGFVGADLSLACTLANTRAVNNAKGNAVENVVIGENDLIWALNHVKPSAMREILVEIPNVKWSDIGGQEELKLKLQQVIEWPLKHPDSFARLGLTPPRGVLLFGPPGCSKTMIAKAVATESKLNFISIKGAELFSKWVGESEKAVREVFRKARIVSPSVIFFDEIDAISGERDSDGAGSNVQERVLSQLLTEMDGIEQLNDVTIVAATNRPDRIDSALLRPGRLDRKLYVPLPDANTRRAIFVLHFGKTPVDEGVDVELLVDRTEGYSGAEVVAVIHEAAMKALESDMLAERVSSQHFEYALTVVKRRTSSELLKKYDAFLEND